MKTRKADNRCCLESGTPHTHDGSEVRPQPTHTPTPWAVSARNLICTKDLQTVIAVEPPYGKSDFKVDAAFIVRAVNSFQESKIGLIKANERLQEALEKDDWILVARAKAAVMVALEAIARAEGR